MSTDYVPGETGRCPHCGVTVKFVKGSQSSQFPSALRLYNPDQWIRMAGCPACGLDIVSHKVGEAGPRLVQPATMSRAPIHKDVPVALRQDYIEATLVLPWSPKASAALSRRCLQALLIQQGANKKQTLHEQINALFSSFPSHIQAFVDHIRELGNFAAHPSTDYVTGEVIEIEPGEADWMLELLEVLFDHYYAKPAEAKERAAKLKAKFEKTKKPTP